MTNRYTWIAWNTHKKVYDALAAGAITLFLAAFLGLTFATADAPPDPAAALIRALGAAAITLLHVVLCIGPLARLTALANPLLYNRRHLGVMTFLVALAHAALATVYYGGFGENQNPLAQILFAGRSLGSIAAFPFELLGFLALVWLFLMAATSHDFWLANLSPRVWKFLHMGVYVAYGLLIAHVALGSLRDTDGWLAPAALFAGVVVVGGLHAAAGVREVLADEAIGVERDPAAAAWVRVCETSEIPEARAKVVCLPGRERVAVFRHGGKLSAISNVCAHQGGPLGEGRVVDGCVTCPWHGYQYRPEDGRSPPPYTEKVPTYRLRVEGRDVYLNTTPLPPGTPVTPIAVTATPDDESLFEDVEKEPITPPVARAEVDPDNDSTAAGDGPWVDPDAPTSDVRPSPEPPR